MFKVLKTLIVDFPIDAVKAVKDFVVDIFSSITSSESFSVAFCKTVTFSRLQVFGVALKYYVKEFTEGLAGKIFMVLLVVIGSLTLITSGFAALTVYLLNVVTFLFIYSLFVVTLIAYYFAPTIRAELGDDKAKDNDNEVFSSNMEPETAESSYEEPATA